MKPILFCAGVLVSSASIAFAQPANRPETSTVRRPVARPNTTTATTPTVAATTLTATLQAAERAQDADALLFSYGQAVTDPQLARAALAQLLGSYFTLRNQAQTADQAVQAISEATLRFQVLQSAQNQVLIQQNQQILNQNARLIELMEIQARKR